VLDRINKDIEVLVPLFMGLRPALESPIVSSLSNDSQKSASQILVKTLLLCIPCWTLAAYCSILVLTAELSPHSAYGLLSKRAIAFVIFLAIFSPISWAGGVVVACRGHRSGGHVKLSTWIILVASGIAMLSTLAVLQHFRTSLD